MVLPPRSLPAALLLLFAGAADARDHNVLVLLADDMGVDRVAAYGEHPGPGKTPVIDTLAAHGVLFRNAWSNPVCSPSRALALSGRYAFRTGVGNSVPFGGEGPTLADDERLLPEVLARRGGLRTAAIGKWHLGFELDDGFTHPIRSGFERHLGTIDSFGAMDPPNIYFSWLKNVADAEGAVQIPTEGYVTTASVDDALAVIEDFGDDPWFVWLAFNAPHAPLHKPPNALHTFDLPPQTFEAPVKHVKAAIEAMDTEIGRLLTSMRPATLARTTVVFAGDNGTTSQGTSAPFDPSTPRARPTRAA